MQHTCMLYQETSCAIYPHFTYIASHYAPHIYILHHQSPRRKRWTLSIGQFLPLLLSPVRTYHIRTQFRLIFSPGMRRELDWVWFPSVLLVLVIPSLKKLYAFALADFSPWMEISGDKLKEDSLCCHAASQPAYPSVQPSLKWDEMKNS